MKNIIIYLNKAVLPVLLLSVILAACEKVEKPYLPYTPPPPAGDSVRKVLIEDFTGHRCVNCPRAAYTIHTFQDKLFPKKVVAIAIHPDGQGTLTKPDADHPADFRTPIATKYATDFSIVGLPNGMVNRKKNATGGNSIYDAEWADTVSAILTKKPDALLKITNTFDNATRKLTSEIKCSFLNDLSGTYKLVVLLTQDSIKSPQEYNGAGGDPDWHGPTIHDYWHMHVLRACISDGTGPASGTGVDIGAIIKGASVTKSFTYDLATTYGNVPVNSKNCNVVAFIYNSVTKEVVQAEDAKLIK